MKSIKKYSVLVVLATWLIIVTFFMVVNRTFDLEIFFVLALVGLLTVAALIDGIISRPHYMRYIDFLIIAGLALFACIIVKKILKILAA